MYDIKPGDIILYKGTSFVAKAIQFFMERYRRRLKLPKRTLFNHAATVIEMWGGLYVAEANSDGIEVRPFSKAYGSKMSKIKIITPKKAYSKAEKKSISKIASTYALEPTRYDFTNFIFQIGMILSTSKKDDKVTKKWSGPVGLKAENRMYCTEAVATWANKVRPNTFNAPWTINPLDVDLNKYYKEAYNGTI